MNANSDDERGIDAFGAERNGEAGRERADGDAIVLIDADPDGALELFATESGSSPIGRPIAFDSLDVFSAEAARAVLSTESEHGRQSDFIAFDHAFSAEAHPFVVPPTAVADAVLPPAPDYRFRDAEIRVDRAEFAPVRASIEVARRRPFAPRRLLIALLFVELLAAAAVAGIFLFGRSTAVSSVETLPAAPVDGSERAASTPAASESTTPRVSEPVPPLAAAPPPVVVAPPPSAVVRPAPPVATSDRRAAPPPVRENPTPARIDPAPPVPPQRSTAPAARSVAPPEVPSSNAAIAPLSRPNVPTPTSPASREPSPAAAAPAPAVAAPAPAVAAPAPPVATAPPPVAAAAPPEPSAAVPTRANDTDAIQATLGRYRTAFNSLDAAAATSVWPMVDQKALGRAFDRLQRQRLTFDSCSIDVSGLHALASCGGTAQYVPKVGNKNARTDRRLWIFNLRKVDDQWLINDVNSR